MRLFSVLILALIWGFSVPAQVLKSSQGALQLQQMASGLAEPWGLAFLPKGGFLITLRRGQLRHYRPGGGFNLVNGLPKVAARGQGGLLDVVVARDFNSSREIFLSFARPGPGGAATALAIARLSEDGTRLSNLRVIFTMKTYSRSPLQFGSRIVEASDGRIFLTVGDRGAAGLAQDLNRHNGSVLRLNRDGSIPGDNPFVNRPGLDEIWSYGHRNAQGAALDLKGRLWLVEHGAKGGDEVNRVRRGRNYGWPVIAYGRHYSGAKIGEGTAKAGMEQPDFYWDPSIAPSGMMIYSGKLWPKWRGDMFIGALKFDYISRLSPGTSGLSEVEKLASPQTGRVRDLREAPDGSIWFLSVDNGAAYRITPAK